MPKILIFYFNGLKFNMGRYEKIHKNNVILIEHKLYNNNQVSKTGSCEPLVFLQKHNHKSE